MKKTSADFFISLKTKASWVRKETLKIHRIAPQIRIASCLSDVEIFVVLYYGRILNFDSHNIKWNQRDRFILSKSHGGVSLYPILADLGFFDKKELKRVCKCNSILGSIPSCPIPGFETITGSLGHGMGVACGVALALKKRNISSKVFVLVGDGELYEGSNWEAIMFAAHHHLDNLIVIVDKNEISMLDYCKNIIDLEPLDRKFKTFNWKVKSVNGHDVEELYSALKSFKEDKYQPKVLIARTIKGRGVPELENNPLCHIRSLTEEEINRAIKKIDAKSPD
jgi:transketolase